MLVRGELPPDPLAGELDQFIERHRLAQRAIELDRAPEFPRSEYEAMGAAGWLGLTTPSALGGRGLSLPRAGALLYRLAYRSGTVFAKLALQPEFSSVLRERGTPQLVETWFRPLCQGRRLVSNQITEPTAGSDAQAIALEASREGDGYLLTGAKSEVAFAEDAEAAIVYGRVPHDPSGGITAFLVPQTWPGVERSRSATDLGERWQRRGTVRYTRVRVPADHRLGEEGRGFHYVRPELTRERALLAAIYLGVGRASWEEVVVHAGQRSVFGRPLSAQEGVAFPLVEDGAHLEATGLYVARTLERLERGEEADADAAVAKWMATDTALEAIDHAIQFHGGRGYSGELPHEQRWRDVRSGGIAHGPSEIMHVVAARALWPRPPRSTAETPTTRDV
ncbi:MAG TPA: acyl-CoA dehydrogenase family protein [Thermoplasmata archaeon]|nr:acyl-CoA dehydrogenase family protein [Thermoplasmata archaeon]